MSCGIYSRGRCEIVRASGATVLVCDGLAFDHGPKPFHEAFSRSLFELRQAMCRHDSKARKSGRGLQGDDGRFVHSCVELPLDIVVACSEASLDPRRSV